MGLSFQGYLTLPTYDYECDACGHTMELFQRISEDPLKKCPECKKNKLRRLFGTGAAIVFKGSGFYETDYRSDSYKKGEKKAKENKQEASSKGDKKSDSGKAKSKSESGSGDSKPKSKPSGGDKKK